MRLCARLGPRNGHTAIHPLDEHTPPLRLYPLYPYEFADGVFVAAAADPALVGLELVAIGGVPLDHKGRDAVLQRRRLSADRR